MKLLDALLTGRTPDSVRSRLSRQFEGTYPIDLEIDRGYPSEEKVEEIRLIAWVDARRWMHDEFPRLWQELVDYGYIEVREGKDIVDAPALEIYVATGGWSGCESVIDAVLDHVALSNYCKERKSGGAYTFIVPHEDPKPYVPKVTVPEPSQ